MKKNTTNITPVENLEVQGARVHNLKNIDLSIPREKLVVFTGLSVLFMPKGNAAI